MEKERKMVQKKSFRDNYFFLIYKVNNRFEADAYDNEDNKFRYRLVKKGVPITLSAKTQSGVVARCREFINTLLNSKNERDKYDVEKEPIEALTTARFQLFDVVAIANTNVILADEVFIIFEKISGDKYKVVTLDKDVMHLSEKKLDEEYDKVGQINDSYIIDLIKDYFNETPQKVTKYVQEILDRLMRTDQDMANELFDIIDNAGLNPYEIERMKKLVASPRTMEDVLKK